MAGFSVVLLVTSPIWLPLLLLTLPLWLPFTALWIMITFPIGLTAGLGAAFIFILITIAELLGEAGIISLSPYEMLTVIIDWFSGIPGCFAGLF